MDALPWDKLLDNGGTLAVVIVFIVYMVRRDNSQALRDNNLADAIRGACRYGGKSS